MKSKVDQLEFHNICFILQKLALATDKQMADKIGIAENRFKKLKHKEIIASTSDYLGLKKFAEKELGAKAFTLLEQLVKEVING